MRLPREVKPCAGSPQAPIESLYEEIPDYIRYYNTRRRHSALGYLTPEAYETMISRGAQVDR